MREDTNNGTSLHRPQTIDISPNGGEIGVYLTLIKISVLPVVGLCISDNIKSPSHEVN